MVKRLNPLFPSFISPEQTGFVQGRQILDGIITSQEVIHSLKHLKAKGMLIKVDLSKAYDRLSWPYLLNILKAFGFDPQWINWVSSHFLSGFLDFNQWLPIENLQSFKRNLTRQSSLSLPLYFGCKRLGLLH